MENGLKIKKIVNYEKTFILFDGNFNYNNYML